MTSPFHPMAGLNYITESVRQTPVAGEYDVVVCGGGPAGIAAAIQAARRGAKTRLLELHGCLGGIWTSGLLTYVIEADKPGTLLDEIKERLIARRAHRRRAGENFIYDPEQMKLVLEELAQEAGVSIQLHTRVAGVSVDECRRLRAVITESKSGRQAWLGKVFIDCTGDGDLAASAGNRFHLGRRQEETQPMSLMALVAGLDPEKVAAFHDVHNRQRKEQLLAEIRGGGHDPSYSAPTLFYIRDDLFALMANHEYSVRPDDAQAISDATVRARAEIHDIVEALRRRGGEWLDIRLVTTAAQIGIREGRRIVGREAVVEGDLVLGRKRSDSICRSNFSMDVHSPDPAFSKGFDFRARRPVLPYDIPYGALVAADVDGLMMAGRCISGDFLAHSSYRVTGNAVEMGDSAGLAAVMCVKEGVCPHELRWPGLPSLATLRREIYQSTK